MHVSWEWNFRVERYHHHEQSVPLIPIHALPPEFTLLISFGCCLYKRMTHYIIFSAFGKHFFRSRKNEVTAFHTSITYTTRVIIMKIQLSLIKIYIPPILRRRKSTYLTFPNLVINSDKFFGKYSLGLLI